MNTSQIKTFAINSRQVLKEGVINKISSLGFNPKGEPVFGLPQKIQGATIYAGKILDESFYDAWMALYDRIKAKGIKDVYEEAAYTWFNRLVAIRIMQKNKLIEPVLAYSSEELRIPRIVAQARAGHLMTEMKASDREKLDELLNDDSKTNEQFALLIENYCRYNPVIFNCFGGIEKYISILLPDNILVQGGFIDLLNHTSYITEEDYTKSELIGWLYQFYIAEKKDEVFDSFKKGKKAEAEDIPAATQIFTPNWIVKYMVQNTLGRTYLDNNPYSTLASQMKYLVGSKTPDEAICRLSDLLEYKLIDPACGSGHILVEAFDLFFLMYCEEGYSPRAAIENILTKNIIGIDLDTRAKQLATFALLMKAVKIDNSFLDCKVMPRVLDMPESFATLYGEPLDDFFPHFGISGEKQIKECVKAFDLLKQADNLGSIMKFDMISDETRWAIKKRLDEWKQKDIIPDPIKQAWPSFELILSLTDKYSAIVANPPYMGNGSMNGELSKYVQCHYPDGKTDLFAVFMYLGMSMLVDNGKLGMINMQSWMFLTSYVNLRKTFLQDFHFDSMLHLGPHTFDELGGEVVQNTSFVITNHISNLEISFDASGDWCGSYYRLVEYKDCHDKEIHFLQRRGEYLGISQSSFEVIPGNPIGYWVSDNVLALFKDKKPLEDFYSFREGIHTADNNRFLRLWTEINLNQFVLDAKSYADIDEKGKWVPYNKGGIYRKWYGNNDYTISFNESSRNEMNQLQGHVRPSQNLYFKEGATWTAVCGNSFGIRYYPEGFLFDAGGQVAVGDNIKSCMAYLNSAVFGVIANLTMPTINFKCGVIKNLPDLRIDSSRITDLVNININISKSDWDAHETSWDFQQSELIRMKDNCGGNVADLDLLDADEAQEIKSKFNVPTNGNLISDCLKAYESEWERKFKQLHYNEEELNRQFIEIYGLQDELTPDVPLDEITILQQGEISIENNAIVWHEDAIIKQFISYAVGCMMGRYRLDKPGLHIAYPNPSDEALAPYSYNGNTIEIDDDGIIPILNRDCFFEDNAYNRVVKFISDVFGPDNLTENLNFVEKSLGKTLEDYLIKDFWKDHKKMYQNRPIYWLFSSNKGAFQVIAYMHRMNPYTVEHIRTKYLLKHIDDLKNRIASDSERAALLSTQERKNLAKMQKDLDECIEYHDRLHVIADQQISFDLDDGVVVNYAKFGDVLAKIK